MSGTGLQPAAAGATADPARRATPAGAGGLALPGLPAPGAHIHMVGVCGTGMTPLALSLRAAGYRVSGEDHAWPAEAERWLLGGGVLRTPGGTLPAGTALVVHSAAVKPGHPVRTEAGRRGVAGLRRGEALAALVRDRPLIAVVGSHGKTTTTAMLAVALRAAGVPCDYLLGGLFGDGVTPPARWEGEGHVVAEIDESDGTIAGFSPEVMLCVNIDWDHFDHYREPGSLEAAFAAMAARTRRAVFYSAACGISRRVFSQVAGPAAVFSFGPGGDFELVEAVDSADGGQTLGLDGHFHAGTARVAAAGAFNAANATAALAVAARLGAADVHSLLAGYPGVRRRQALLPARPGVTVIEDYAHHPVEIEALLAAMRARFAGRLVAVFQPHRHSRTAQFKDAFAHALARADRVVLLEVYPAGEDPVAGGHSADVLAALRAREQAPPAELIGDAEAAPEALARGATEGDLLLFVGAGDIEAVARRTSELLARPAGAPSPWREDFLRGIARRLSPDTIVRVDEPLGAKTTIRVGGAAEVFAEPANTADLQALLAVARGVGARVHLLGRGSNLIVPDDGVRGVVVRLQHPHWQRFACLGPRRYWAGAGLRLKELCGMACRMGETGFEFFEGIPGTVGGALRMNAGAMGGWIFEVVEQVHFLGPDGTFHIRPSRELHVGYRRCQELENGIAVGAVLRATGAAERAKIRALIEEFQRTRAASQPREPSAGCVFRNPPGDSAGRIIDELGLKGLRVGDAEVSAVHANFIINRGHATGSDVIALIRRLRDEVRNRRQIELEPEVLLFGREWREVL